MGQASSRLVRIRLNIAYWFLARGTCINISHQLTVYYNWLECSWLNIYPIRSSIVLWALWKRIKHDDYGDTIFDFKRSTYVYSWVSRKIIHLLYMCMDFFQWSFSFIQSMPFNDIVDTLLIVVYVWHFSHDLVHFAQCKYTCTGAKINGAQDTFGILYVYLSHSHRSRHCLLVTNQA